MYCPLIPWMLIAVLLGGCTVPVKLTEERYDYAVDEIMCKQRAATPLQAVRCVPPMLR